MDKTPKDQRSESLNPNSSSYKASADNRSNQMNPNNPSYQGNWSKGKR